MIDREDALHNLANYEDIDCLIFLLNNIHNLYNLSHKGNATALTIYMDITGAMLDDRLTDKQKYSLYQKYFRKENNVYIAEQLGVTENAVRKHLRGGLKRIQKILTVGVGWNPKQ